MKCCERCGYNIMFPVTIIRKGVAIDLCKKCHDIIKEEEDAPLSMSEDR